MLEPTLQLPRNNYDWFSQDFQLRRKRLALEVARHNAKCWMWINNIKEYRHELRRQGR